MKLSVYYNFNGDLLLLENKDTTQMLTLCIYLTMLINCRWHFTGHTEDDRIFAPAYALETLFASY